MTSLPAAEVRKYVKETSDGFHFLDPVHRTELVPHEPPPSLLEDVLTSQGIQYLKSAAQHHRIAAKIFHAPHAERANFDNGIEDPEQLIRAGIFGVETNWRSDFSPNGDTELSAVEYIFAEYPGRAEFQKRQLQWLEQHDILAFSCEYPDNYETPLYQNFMEIVQLSYKAKNAGDLRSMNILRGAYQTTRQWIFIAMLGYWLKRFHTQKISTGDEIVIPVMLGGHISIRNKFIKYFNIATQGYGVTDMEEYLRPYVSPNYFEMFTDITEHARITHKQLENPFYYIS